MFGFASQFYVLNFALEFCVLIFAFWFYMLNFASQFYIFCFAPQFYMLIFFGSWGGEGNQSHQLDVGRIKHRQKIATGHRNIHLNTFIFLIK